MIINTKLLLIVLAVSACSKSKCEKYGDMELKCFKELDTDTGRAVLRGTVGLCQSSKPDLDAKALADLLHQKADCADNHEDCSSYEKCLDRTK